MTSRHEAEVNPENEPTRHPQQPLSPTTNSEAAYDRMTSYAFARRYVKGKVVADVGHGEVGYGSCLLAQTAESIIALSASPEAIDFASGVHSSPNMIYRRVDLPELPYPENHFDVVVAFGVLEELENPEEFLGEARRVLKKEGGALLLSVSDKRAYANGGNGQGNGRRRGMCVAELKELVGRHFGSSRIYRQGAVAGGLVFPDATQVETSSKEAVEVEIAQFSLSEPALSRFGSQPPRTRSVVAVCYDQALEQVEWQEQPYLLLDRDQGVFGETEDLAEDLELTLGEIEQMQQSEVQAFVEAIRAQRQQNLAQLQMRYLLYIRSFLGHRRNVAREDVLHLRNIIYGNIYALRKKGLEGSVRGALRRSVSLYRRLVTKDGNLD